MPDKELIHTDAPTPKKTMGNGGNDPVQKAKDEATIALETQKAEFARQNVKDLNELKEQQKQVLADRQKNFNENQILIRKNEVFEKQKEDWLEEFDEEKEKWQLQRNIELDKMKQAKEYWESKKDAVVRQQKINTEHEQRINSLMTGLDEKVELKKQQIVQLQEIIDTKAPQYHKLFKQMLSKSEERRNWNYNMARGDQLHNFTERVSIIYHSLHEMLFG